MPLQLEDREGFGRRGRGADLELCQLKGKPGEGRMCVSSPEAPKTTRSQDPLAPYEEAGGLRLDHRSLPWEDSTSFSFEANSWGSCAEDPSRKARSQGDQRAQLQRPNKGQRRKRAFHNRMGRMWSLHYLGRGVGTFRGGRDNLDLQSPCQLRVGQFRPS